MASLLQRALSVFGLGSEKGSRNEPPRPEVTVPQAELERIVGLLGRMHALMVEDEEFNFSGGIELAAKKLSAAIAEPESRSELFYQAADTYLSMCGGMGSLTDFYLCGGPPAELEARRAEYGAANNEISKFFRAHLQGG